ncbi:DNA-binding response regulator [Gemmatimonadetes bacterium T265]|nr:DNA-binding response regulator [Gemmatimonadetes bacterium T265]
MTVLVVDDEPLGRQRLLSLLEREADVTIIGECEGGMDALNAITRDGPELVFLDVRMPDLSGVGVIEALDEASRPEVVFVTAFDEYMERAFHLHAVDYLRKPFTDDDFASALARARRLVAGRRAVAEGATDARVVERRQAVAAAVEQAVPCTGRHLPVRARADGRWKLLDPDTVVAVEADAGVAVRLYVGTEAHTWDATMTRAEQATARFGFVRVHRRWVINPDHVVEIVPRHRGEYTLVLTNATEVPTGRSYRENVERALGLADC